MKKNFLKNLLVALSVVPSLHGTLTTSFRGFSDTFAALTYIRYMEDVYETGTMGNLLDYKNRDGRNVIDRLYDENVIHSDPGTYMHLMWNCGENRDTPLRDWEGNPLRSKKGIFLRLKMDLIALLKDEEKNVFFKGLIEKKVIERREDLNEKERFLYSSQGYNLGRGQATPIGKASRPQEDVVSPRQYAAFAYVHFMEENYETKTMGDLLDYTDHRGKNIIDRIYEADLVSTTGGIFLNLMEGCTEHREIPLKDWKKDPCSGEGIFRELEKRMVEIVDPGLEESLLAILSPALVQGMNDMLKESEFQKRLQSPPITRCSSTPPIRMFRGGWWG